jgi:glycosyltransferase involved in cell wall biosynthesis
MIHLFLNGLAASAGGGLTYLRNVVPELSVRADVRTTVALGAQLRSELQDLPNISVLETPMPGDSLGRFWREQTVLPRLIRECGADVLISAGNFALRKSPVPQILLSRNSLYTSQDFFRDLRVRRDFRLWLDTHVKGILAKRSIRWADCSVAPSRAFADELEQWSGKEVTTIHHGFDRDTFFSDQGAVPRDLKQKLGVNAGTLRLLFVSHYNYYRNFETLFRALPLMREGLGGRKIKLFLTCALRSEATAGGYHPEQAAALIKQLGVTESVVELGTVSYPQLHHVYRACDIYVTPAYAESFAHPLVEAMASGLPVVASNLPVHREICGAGALYFSPFSPKEFADQILRVATSEELARDLSARGRLRSQEFSWRVHVEQLVGLASGLITCRALVNQSGVRFSG